MTQPYRLHRPRKRHHLTAVQAWRWIGKMVHRSGLPDPRPSDCAKEHTLRDLAVLKSGMGIGAKAHLHAAGVRQGRDRRRRRSGSRQQCLGRRRAGADAHIGPADLGDRRHHALGVPELRHQSGAAAAGVAAATGLGPDRLAVHRQRHAAGAQPAADRGLGEAAANSSADPLRRHSRVRDHRHLWHHPVSGGPDPALSHRRDRIPHAPLRLPRRSRHHRNDPGTAGGAELPPGHDDFRRGLDRVLHAAAVGDHPGAGGARPVRPQALRARGAAESPITCPAMRESGTMAFVIKPSRYGGTANTASCRWRRSQRSR